VGPRAGLDTEDTGKKPSASARDRTSIARSSSPQPDTALTELSGSPDVKLLSENICKYH
jgi:hypothetical protein